MAEVDGVVVRLLSEAANCAKCRFALFQEEGVEGRTFYCTIQAHPKDEFDPWYKDDPRLRYGAMCPYFVPGPPIKVDVERDALPSLTPVELRLYNHRMGLDS